MTNIIDGKNIASTIRTQLKQRIDEIKEQYNIVPKLSVVIVGDNPASMSYVKGKEKACMEVGIISDTIHLPESTTEEDLVTCIKRLNNDISVDGILVQLPLPKHIRESVIINTISPKKDVDGFTHINVGKMVVGEDCFIPCTPAGIIELIKSVGVETSGKHIVVVGRSNIVGKPLVNLLSSKTVNSTVTVCHTGTPDISKYTKEADIVIVATGRPNTLSGKMIKSGAIVIDVGVNRIPDETKTKGFRLVGDVDFDSCLEIASYITPVPGGVGPMTIAMLLKNTVISVENKI